MKPKIDMLLMMKNMVKSNAKEEKSEKPSKGGKKNLKNAKKKGRCHD